MSARLAWQLTLLFVLGSSVVGQELEPGRLALYFRAPTGEGKALWRTLTKLGDLAGAEFERLPAFQPEHMKPVPKSSFEIRYLEGDLDGQRLASALIKALRQPGKGGRLAAWMRRWPPTSRSVRDLRLPQLTPGKVPLVLVFAKNVPQVVEEDRSQRLAPLPLSEISVDLSVSPRTGKRLLSGLRTEPLLSGIAFAEDVESLHSPFKIPIPEAAIEIRYCATDIEGQRAAETLLARLRGESGDLTKLRSVLQGRMPVIRPVPSWRARTRSDRRGRIEVVYCATPKMQVPKNQQREPVEFPLVRTSIQTAAPPKQGRRVLSALINATPLGDAHFTGRLDRELDAFRPRPGKVIEIRYLTRDGKDGKLAAQSMLDLIVGRKGEIAGLSNNVRSYGAQIREVEDWAGLHVVPGRVPLLVVVAFGVK